MAEVLPLSETELRLLESLQRHKIRFLVVGLSAAALQGAPVVTQDVDLWFEKLGDPKISRAVRRRAPWPGPSQDRRRRSVGRVTSLLRPFARQEARRQRTHAGVHPRIGAVDVMSRLLEAPSLLVGFVLPDCFAHAPNERLDLDSFYLGRKAALHLWEEIAAIGVP